MIAVSGNYPATTLAVKIGRRIRIFADTFADDNHYLSVALNFPSMLLVTINNTLK